MPDQQVGGAADLTGLREVVDGFQDVAPSLFGPPWRGPGLRTCYRPPRQRKDRRHLLLKKDIGRCRAAPDVPCRLRRR